MLKNDNVNNGPYFISALFKREKKLSHLCYFIGQDFDFWFMLSLVHMFVQFVTITATEINSVLKDFLSLKMRFTLDF